MALYTISRIALRSDLGKVRRPERDHQVTGRISGRTVSSASLLRPGQQALLRTAQDGRQKIVLPENLDRPSCDQAGIAAVYKRPAVTGVRIFTWALDTLSFKASR